jgi:hypothetical protein
MRHRIVTYSVKPGDERENVALVRAVFTELAQARLRGRGGGSSRTAGHRQRSRTDRRLPHVRRSRPSSVPRRARPGHGQFGLEAGTHRPLAPASGARAQLAEAAPTPPARDEAALSRWHVEPTFLLGFGRAQKRHAG